MKPNNTPPTKGGQNKKDGRAIGIRFDLGEPLEREAYEYIQSWRNEFTPRQIIVSALVGAARDGHYPSASTSGVNTETVYNAVVEALMNVIGDGQLIVSSGQLAIQNNDGSIKAIMSDEAQRLLGFVDELGEF